MHTHVHTRPIQILLLYYVFKFVLGNSIEFVGAIHIRIRIDGIIQASYNTHKGEVVNASVQYCTVCVRSTTPIQGAYRTIASLHGLIN